MEKGKELRVPPVPQSPGRRVSAVLFQVYGEYDLEYQHILAARLPVVAGGGKRRGLWAENEGGWGGRAGGPRCVPDLNSAGSRLTTVVVPLWRESKSTTIRSMIYRLRDRQTDWAGIRALRVRPAWWLGPCLLLVRPSCTTCCLRPLSTSFPAADDTMS